MSLNHEARLERLLARHRDAVLSEGPNGATALHRKDQILVATRHADRAHEAVERYTERRDDLLDVGVTRLHLRPGAGVDPCELIGQLRTHDTGSMAVSLNHLMRGEPEWYGGPFGVPKACAPMPKPVAVDTSARRVFAGVIDTGIVSHPWFADSDWFAQVSPDQLDPIPAEVDYALETQTGHGTFVAGTLLRQAPTAFLMIERALGDDGVGDELEVLRSLARLRDRLRATGETLDVLNLSLGGYTFDDEPSPLVAESLGRFGKQTVIVVAAGNNGSNRPFWPATLKSCIAVGALEPDGTRRAEFSNHGWWVDACSVGANVCGPFINDGHEFFGFAEWSGTSFAAPRVAGAIAGFAASKHLSAIEAAETLLDTASRQCHPDFGVVVE
jgi:hypothetical protein